MHKQLLQPLAQVLGYAGVMPQLAFVAAATFAPPVAPAAAILGWAYAGLIFSFLGGVWWGMALTAERAPGWLLPLSVLPSLIGLLSVVPIVLGLAGASLPLAIVGVGLLASPLVDSRLSRDIALPIGWLRLRWHLSIGLGIMTMLLAVWA